MNRRLEPITVDRIDGDAAKVVRRLMRHGFEAYLVGGCVRDLLLGREPKDFDVATSATPQEIRQLFRNCRIIGRRFRLAHVFFDAHTIETATFRAPPLAADEGDAQDPLVWHDNEFGTAEEDALRRDFTINGLFYDLATGKVIDWVGGMLDLRAATVRTIGDPDARFQEDPVRIIRAVKFSARLGFALEEETRAAAARHGGLIARCSIARVLEEIYKLLREGTAQAAFEQLAELGVLSVLFPELAAVACPGGAQGPALRAGGRHTGRGLAGPGFDGQDDSEQGDDGSSGEFAEFDTTVTGDGPLGNEARFDGDQAWTDEEEPAGKDDDSFDDASEDDDSFDDASEDDDLFDGASEDEVAGGRADLLAAAGDDQGSDDMSSLEHQRGAPEVEDEDGLARGKGPIDEHRLAEQLLIALDLGPSENRARAAELLWAQLGALDHWVSTTGQAPAPPVLLGIILSPLIHHGLGAERRIGVAASYSETLVRAVALRLQVSRRHRERLKQILVAQRRMAQTRGRRGLNHRDYFPQALELLKIRAPSCGLEDALARWEAPEGSPAPSRRRRSRRGRAGRSRRGALDGAEGAASAATPGSDPEPS